MTPGAPLPDGERSGFSRFLWRIALITFWCVVLWGTLLDAGILVNALTQGLSPVRQFLLERPKEDVAAAWGNRIAGLVAPLVWLLVAGSLRRARGGEEGRGEETT